jgi:hypothetical protein
LMGTTLGGRGGGGGSSSCGSIMRGHLSAQGVKMVIGTNRKQD